MQTNVDGWLRDLLKNKLDEPIISISRLTGGDTASSFLIKGRHQSYFVKSVRGSKGKSMLTAELEGLLAISATHSINIPDGVSLVESNDTVCLLMHHIKETTPSNNFWENFGVKMAALHRNTANYFGWEATNFIGALTQHNEYLADWDKFYARNRILPQVALAYNDRLLSKKEVVYAETLCKEISSVFPSEAPALCHGDFWHGNFLTGDLDEAYLIDPAIHYGHREMDLSMSLLFGGFSERFYTSYQESFALHKGWKDRVKFGQLYYLLVHLNLFGASYKPGVMQILGLFR